MYILTTTPSPPPRLPFNYLGECNYGGRVTDDKDRRSLMTLLKLYYNDKTVDEPGHSFSPSGIYRIPDNTTYNGVLDYIKSLPLETKPEVFSLHENADITRNQLETNLFFAAILVTQARSESGGGKSNEQMIMDMAGDMLSRLPEAFDLGFVSAKYPVTYSESMNTVLLQEVIRFRTLTEVVRESLKNIQKVKNKRWRGWINCQSEESRASERKSVPSKRF